MTSDRNKLPTPSRLVVAVLVEPPLLAFELGIACQLFGLDRSDDGLPTYDFRVCAAQAGPLATTSLMWVTPTHDLAAAEESDVVVVPGWAGLEVPPSGEFCEVLRSAVAREAGVMSICTGAFALAGAGVLDGRRATTHWQFTARLRRAYPQVRVEPDSLYVTDGPVLTSAGAAAGIDAGLHLLRELHGSAVAAAVARRMVLPAYRTGGQAQFVERPVAGGHRDDGLTGLLDWIVENLHRPLTVRVMARQARMSPRTFVRRFTETTGTTPHRWLVDRRTEHAERLLETTDMTIGAVAKRSGFGATDTLRHAMRERRGTTPSAHRRAFGGQTG
ncbi:helix-turn-helix domain-containing protein [Euzebya tangerina]|uniref:helix-turn-helix domain-containing protein n=1 Tax=Euzebya tangerina TaxID=591198 RepID=UPI000E31D5E2|nr:helix-turn-helix domain-containing protein [Euzebya tangerina]